MVVSLNKGGWGYLDGDLEKSKFDSPVLTVDEQHSNIYIADRGNHRIRKIDLKTQKVSTIAGRKSEVKGREVFRDGVLIGQRDGLESPLLTKGNSLNTQFFDLRGIMIVNDKLYFTYYGGFAVLDLKTNQFKVLFNERIHRDSSIQDIPTELGPLHSSSLDTFAFYPPNTFYIYDNDGIYKLFNNQVVLAWDTSSTPILGTKDGGPGVASVNGTSATNLAFDRKNNVYFASYAHIRKITTENNIETITKSFISQGTLRVRELAFDYQGNLYLADESQIWKVYINEKHRL